MFLPFMADGIAMYRLECNADVIGFVVDVLTTGCYLSLSSMLFIRTSSYTCGRWYLPMFLFRDGLLTLMNIDSFISLERFCSSLSTILKLLVLVVWPVVLLWSCIGQHLERGLKNTLRPPHWSYYQHQQLQYSGQERAKPLQADKRISVH